MAGGNLSPKALRRRIEQRSTMSGESALPLGPVTIEGVEVVTIPLAEYADLLAARRRLAELEPADRMVPRYSSTPSSPFDADPEICAFLLARLGKMTQKDILTAAVAEFGSRAPSKSALCRFYQRHWTPERSAP